MRVMGWVVNCSMGWIMGCSVLWDGLWVVEWVEL